MEAMGMGAKPSTPSTPTRGEEDESEHATSVCNLISLAVIFFFTYCLNGNNRLQATGSRPAATPTTAAQTPFVCSSLGNVINSFHTSKSFPFPQCPFIATLHSDTSRIFIHSMSTSSYTLHNHSSLNIPSYLQPIQILAISQPNQLLGHFYLHPGPGKHLLRPSNHSSLSP